MINNILLSPPNSYEVPASTPDVSMQEPDTTFEDMIKNAKNSNEDNSVNSNNKPDNEKNPIQNSNEANTSHENDDSNSDLDDTNNKENELKKNNDKISDENDLDKDDKKDKKIKTDEVFFFENIENDTSVDIETIELIKDIEMLMENIENILESDNTLDDSSKNDIKNILALLDGVKSLLQNKGSLESKDLMIADTKYSDLGELKNLLAERGDKEGIEKLLSNMNTSKNLESIISKLEATLDLKLNMKENSNTENVQAFDNIDRDISNGENVNSFGKDSGNSSGGGDNNNSKNNSKPNMIDTDATTEFTIVNTKDDFSRSEFVSSKTVSQTKADVSELLSKFQDVMTKLVDKARMALSNGKTEIIMALKPDSLGNINLKMTMEGDEIRGKIFVDNAEIKDIFTKNIDTVIKSLSEAGISIEGFDIMFSQDMPSNEQQEFSDLLGERGEGREESNAQIAIDAEASLMIDKYLLPERKLNIVI